MDLKERYKCLEKAAYEVIEEEGLPKPDSIKFRFSLNGTRKRNGTIFHNKNDNRYRILIHRVRARWVVDNENGTYIGESGRKYRRIMGTEIPFPNITRTTGHEIAHLKFWNHGPEHKSYTDHITEKLIQKLGGVYSEI